MAGSCSLLGGGHWQRSPGAEFGSFKMAKIMADAFKTKRPVRAEKITCLECSQRRTYCMCMT